LARPPNGVVPPELYEGDQSFQPPFSAALLGAQAALVGLQEEIANHLMRILPVTFLVM
jgi:hypothetical protein